MICSYCYKSSNLYTIKYMKTTPKEKMIINLMEEVINILHSVNDLSSPEFSMYITMAQAVDKEVFYPLYD